jgi:predicted metal-dependent phosphotriesterase family hydrolase
VILGEDEQAQGKVKIKEMGLPEGHPEKDGVAIEIGDLVPEVKKRLAIKAAQESKDGTAVQNEAESSGVGVKTVVDATKELEIEQKS